MIKEIHIYDCILGPLKISKDMILEIKDYGFKGYVEEIEFPAHILDGCEECLEKMS